MSLLVDADPAPETLALMTESYLADDRPWVVAYSGGKDSTLVLQLVYEMLLALGPRATKPVHVVSSDTGVEPPNVARYVERTLKAIEADGKRRGLDLTCHLVRPKVEEGFWAKLIGKGYPPPTRWFRWCTTNMKIKPSRRAIDGIVARHVSVILLLGTRRAESSARAARMDRRVSNLRNLNPHHVTLPACSASHSRIKSAQEWRRHDENDASLTDKPMKGMLTGPVTMLNWSFVRDDQPRSVTCRQLALAIRAEVLDLEKAGVRVIQIDEAALREGLPLRKSQWGEYLDWAVDSFRITANGVADETQIHTHMCYSEFNDIIASIAEMDADVITIETSRSDMELLDAFDDFNYPNQIGPGVYDIHAPNIPVETHIIDLMKKAAERIPADRLWVNPDCGLKTRQWSEVIPALTNMVSAALRNQA